MRLSCTSSMVSGSTFTEKAQNLKKWGYEGIGVFVEYSDWSEELAREIECLEKNTGIVPCEFVFQDSSYGHLMDNNHPELRDKARKMYKEAAAFCAKIGAVTELEFEYGAQDPLPMFSPYQKMTPQKEAEFIGVFRDIASEVEGTEGYVLLEPINRYEAPYLNNVDDCREASRKTNLNNVGILWDTFHLSIEEKDIPKKIIEAGKDIKYVHLGDNNRLPPGSGNLNWREIIKAFKEIGYSGFMSLECALAGNPEIVLPDTAVFLKSLMIKEKWL